MNLFRKLADLWLNFSRGERNGILVLSVLLLLLIFFNTLIPLLPQRKITQEQKNKLLALADSLWHVPDSFRVISVVPFDPNILAEEDWQRIGLTKRQAGIIIRYRNAGGRFRKPEDLFRIYGLDSTWVRSIIPYVQIPQSRAKETDTAVHESPGGEKKFYSQEYHKPTNPGSHYAGEINTADSVALVRLNGIGPVTARRIINYRTRLGGFVSMEQLREVYGMHPEMLKVLNEYFVCDSLHIKKIPVNRVGEKELSLHPYLSRWNARSILKFRDIKGKITDVNELKDNQILPDSVFRKIYPYLSVE
ncbi:MAG: helix-hairpin-helix domain-containing protein [Bacteroidales bacterium]|nr:helix-hairpin-helix domain-containing protein [Bacteroidales bacterium]